MIGMEQLLCLLKRAKVVFLLFLFPRNLLLGENKLKKEKQNYPFFFYIGVSNIQTLK